MREVFADTTFLLALIVRTDPLHYKAITLHRQLGAIRIVSTEFILAEVFRLVAKRGRTMRAAAVALCNEMQECSDWTVLPVTQSLFKDAKELYATHDDKLWDLVDCASFVVMQERGLCDALTYDHHFQQMGFRALLRDD